MQDLVQERARETFARFAYFLLFRCVGIILWHAIGNDMHFEYDDKM